jgi:periplasmic copper chaperone A
MEGGVMKMRPVEGGLEIKPGETVTLAPAGFHMMLVTLKHPLEAGQTVKATLKFDKAGAVMWTIQSWQSAHPRPERLPAGA